MATTQEVELISEEQLGLLKELKQFETSLQFQSLTQIPLLNTSSSNFQTSQQQKRQSFQSNNQMKLSRSIQSINLQPQVSTKKSSFLLANQGSQSLNQTNNPKPLTQQQNTFLFIDMELQRQGKQKYMKLKRELISYKQKSEQIYKVGEFIKAYEENFTMLVKQKDQLITMLASIKGETTHLVEKQKKLIDLSMAIKESLDYYSYHQKNTFNYACEISSRQLFEDSLQSTLSSIMDAIQFFEQNPTFAQSKKQLNTYLSHKSKIISFIKSFFIKLFNKENAFVMKHLPNNRIEQQINAIYPKSRTKLVTEYLGTFPHAKKDLKDILSQVRDNVGSSEEKDMEGRALQMRQLEIDEFVLSEANVALIRYLQKNNYELYTEVMLNLFTFNRFNFHENFIFNWARRISTDPSSSIPQGADKQKQRLRQYKSKIYFIIQTIVSEYLYFHLCCHPSISSSVQFITSWLYKLVHKYLDVLVKESREIVVKWKVNPFELCELICGVVGKQLNSYFDNLSKEQYQSYVMGTLWQSVNAKYGYFRQQNNRNEENPHSKLLKQLFKNSLQSRLLSQLSQFCFQYLPKLQLTTNRNQVEQNINKLTYIIPKLQYCTNNADNYMISSLDVLIKSIKQINVTIQSRFQCYSWNLLLFGVIKNILQAKEFQVVSKEIRLDFNQSLNIIDRVKQLERPQSLIKYAQDIFNVIKTGMPSLNELTLDFNKYVNEHYAELEERFLKDILFIYAKNMVQFLQKVMDYKKKITHEKQTLKKEANIDHLHGEHSQNENQNVLLKKIHSEGQLTRQAQQQLQSTTPKTQKKSSRRPSEGQKICDSFAMKSLYNSYVLSIEKYIKEARDMVKMAAESKIEKKDSEISNLKGLIREVYEKMFDFLDTFYVAVSEFNEEVTFQFEEISTIKEKQESLWLQK